MERGSPSLCDGDGDGDGDGLRYDLVVLTSGYLSSGQLARKYRYQLALGRKNAPKIPFPPVASQPSQGQPRWRRERDQYSGAGLEIFLD